MSSNYVRISELPFLSNTSLISSESAVIPVVANVGGITGNVTYYTDFASIKKYIEVGDLTITGNLTANAQIIGSITTVNSSGNLIDIQTDINLDYPLSDNSKDVGLRVFYYKTAGDSAALVWKNANQRLTWFGSNVGNDVTNISANAVLGNMELGQLFVSNITPTTGVGTGALQVAGGASIGNNLYVGGNITLTSNVSTPGSGNFGFLQVNNSASISGNISAPYFVGNATHALYADLAEKYISDNNYSESTVVVFGGEKEITVTDIEADTRVAGVISENPAYLMNIGSDGQAVALRGKVPVQIIGPVEKGDLLVTSSIPGYATSFRNANVYNQSAVFAKSLETSNLQVKRTIMAVIL
jgi:hypothetical protein